MYEGSASDDFNVSVELLDRCISKLKCVKAAGHDGLTSEHLWYAWQVSLGLLSLSSLIGG